LIAWHIVAIDSGAVVAGDFEPADLAHFLPTAA
jgi:hypothetical protein